MHAALRRCVPSLRPPPPCTCTHVQVTLANGDRIPIGAGSAGKGGFSKANVIDAEFVDLPK